MLRLEKFFYFTFFKLRSWSCVFPYCMFMTPIEQVQRSRFSLIRSQVRRTVGKNPCSNNPFRSTDFIATIMLRQRIDFPLLPVVIILKHHNSSPFCCNRSNMRKYKLSNIIKINYKRKSRSNRRGSKMISTKIIQI